MKILSISSLNLNPYLGSGKTRIAWTNGLKELGHQVDVLQPSDYAILSSFKSGKKYKTALGIFIKVSKLLKSNQYDLIEFYGDEYWLLLLWMKFVNKTHVLTVAHVDGIELYDMAKAQKYWTKRTGFKKWLYKNTHYRFAKMTFKNADRFVCGCQSDLNYVLENNIFDKNYACCISPGIDNYYHKIKYQEKKDKNIIFIGSWIGRKGIQLVPPVITEVLAKYPEYRFDVFGAWSSKKMIKEAFSECYHEKINVYDKLPVDELLSKIETAAIYFFPSYSEGFGLATAEAMSCSCAVVTTPTGLGANLTHMINALICEHNDTNSMIKAVSELIENEELRKTISLNGFNKAKEFVWDIQVKKLEETYNNWLDEVHN